MTQSDKECVGGGGLSGQMQYKMYKVGDQLRVTQHDWMEMIFLHRLLHINKTRVCFVFYLQQLHVCDWIQLTHHV